MIATMVLWNGMLILMSIVKAMIELYYLKERELMPMKKITFNALLNHKAHNYNITRYVQERTKRSFSVTSFAIGDTTLEPAVFS